MMTSLVTRAFGKPVPAPTLALSAVLVILLTAVTACTSGSADSDGRSHEVSGPLVSGGTVTIATNAEIPSFNPYGQYGLGVSQYLYDPLVNAGPNGTVVSGLASKWTATPTQATFTLRKGVTCSDGHALTATDVADALTYASDPTHQLAGAQSTLPTVPFTVSGDASTGTVTVTMASPYSFITRTIGELPIACPAGLATPTTLDRASIGTGPYVLSGYSSGGPYTMTLRKGYTWGPGRASTAAQGQPAKLVLSVITDESTAANLLSTGGINIASVSGPDRQRLSSGRFSEVDSPVMVGQNNFNEAPGHVTSDPAVRKALVAALDRQQLANVAVGGTGKPATDTIVPTAACHADLAATQLPKGDAAAMLRAAGWTKNATGVLSKNGTPLSIRLVTSPTLGSTLPAVAELMATTWKSLGVDVSTTSENLNALVKTMYGDGNFEDILGTGAAFPNPAGLIPYYDGPKPPNGLNFASVNNPTYERLAKQALGAEGTSGCGAWQQASASLLNNADVLPIADGTSATFGYRTSFTISFGALGALVSPTSLRLHS